MERRANLMIPKTIHYTWFGGGSHPPAFTRFRQGWARLLPDWKFIEWNEQRFAVASHPWTERCHRERRFAFVSDFVRLHALHEHGGFYLDTDVELYRSLEPYRAATSCWGFEFDCYLSTCLIGAQPGQPLIRDLLAQYDDLPKPVVNNSLVTRHFLARYPEFRLTGAAQTLADGTVIHPKDMFAIPSHHPERNVARHWGDYSWADRPRSRLGALKRLLRRALGDVRYFRGVSWWVNQRNEFAPIRKAHLRKTVS